MFSESDKSRFPKAIGDENNYEGFLLVHPTAHYSYQVQMQPLLKPTCYQRGGYPLLQLSQHVYFSDSKVGGNFLFSVIQDKRGVWSDIF